MHNLDKVMLCHSVPLLEMFFEKALELQNVFVIM